MSDLSQAIDALADAVPHGHLLAATNGADLLHEAARLLEKREADLAAARAQADALLDSQYRAGVTAGWNAAQLPPGEAQKKLASLRRIEPGALAALPTAPKGQP